MGADQLKQHLGAAKRSFRQFLRKIAYPVLLLALGPAYRLAAKSRLIRRFILDSAESNTLLISAGRTETFVICASDKMIGRNVYVNKKPYDFEKMAKILSILGDDRPKMLLIDIGANIGTICIPAVKRGLFEKAIAVEPEPLNYRLLLANVHINGLRDKITTHNLALGQKADEHVLLELSKYNFGDHRVRIKNNSGVHYEEHRETISVKSETFDKVIQNLKPKESSYMDGHPGIRRSHLIGCEKRLTITSPNMFGILAQCNEAK